MTLDPDKEPAPLSRILVLKQPWLDLILDQQKKLECRHQLLKPGEYWLGYQKKIHGIVTLGKGRRVSTVEEWRSLRCSHMVEGDEAFFSRKRICVIPIENARRRGTPLAYAPARGAQGIALFRPVKTDERPKRKCDELALECERLCAKFKGAVE